MECLTLAFEQHSGMQDPRTNAKEGMVSFFVDGLRPKVSEAIQSNVIGWEAKTLLEIVSIVATSLKQKWEEKKTRLMALQLHAFENLPALSSCPRPKIIPPNFPLAFAPQHCFHCSREGHFKFSCPYLSASPLQHPENGPTILATSSFSPPGPRMLIPQPRRVPPCFPILLFHSPH